MANVQVLQTFRRRYRAKIAANYKGQLHALIVILAGLSVISYALMQLKSVGGQELLTIPITLVMVNFAEYAAHRWLGHKKRQLMKLFYLRHTIDHHNFFLESVMAFDNTKDWRVVLFPAYLIFAFIFGLILPIGYLLTEFVSANVAYLYAISAISGYLLYEVLHFSYHIPKNKLSYKLFSILPGWLALKRLHTLHHNKANMTNVNFNVTYPLFDIILKTYYCSAKKKKA